MSLAIKYETVEDARMRLRGTVVLYRGNPVYIRDVQAGNGKDDIFRVLFDELPLAGGGPFKPAVRPRHRLDGDDLELDEAVKPERKFISSKHFDIGPFKMGYVNAPKGAFYCSRLPNRIQKQGLCVENFSGKDNFGNAVGFNTCIACKEFEATVNGRYPTFDQAVQGLEKSKAVAFHREFCLVKDEVVPNLLWLYHKGTKVGMFNRGEATLGPKYGCLKEALQEMKLKVGVY